MSVKEKVQYLKLQNSSNYQMWHKDMEAVFCSKGTMEIAFSQKPCPARPQTQPELTEFEFIKQVMQPEQQAEHPCRQQAAAPPLQQTEINQHYKTYKVE